MSTEPKSSSSRVYDIVQAVLLAVVGLVMTWTVQTVVAQGRELSAHNSDIKTNSGRLTSLEDRGSRQLGEHVKMDDSRSGSDEERITKLEAAVIALSTIPGDIRFIRLQMETLENGQKRIEKKLEKP